MNIDLISDFLDRQDAKRVGQLIERTNELVGLFREAGLPIIWVRQEFASNLSDAFLEMRDHSIRRAISGTPGPQMDPRLAWDDADITFVKKRYSAFFRTGLDEVLDRHDIGELVLTGVNAHACVRTSAIDAYQRDLRVILATDCLSSYDEEHAAISLRYMARKIGRTLTNDEIRQHLGCRSSDV